LGRSKIVEVFIAVAHLLFQDGGCPGVASTPFHIAGQIKDYPFVGPVYQIGRRETLEIGAAPALEPVGGGVEVVFPGLLGVENFGVGIVAVEGGIMGLFCHHLPGGFAHPFPVDQIGYRSRRKILRIGRGNFGSEK